MNTVTDSQSGSILDLRSQGRLLKVDKEMFDVSFLAAQEAISHSWYYGSLLVYI